MEDAFAKAGYKSANRRLDDHTKHLIQNCSSHAEAARSLIGFAMSDADLLAALVGKQYIEMCVSARISRLDRKKKFRRSSDMRRKENRGAASQSRQPRSSLQEQMRIRTTVANSVLTSFVVNGQPVGKITAAEARQASHGFAGRSNFLRTLAEGLPDDMRIEDGRTADEANALYDRFVRSAA